MSDPTEGARRELVAEINADPNGREAQGARYGKVWDTSEDFEVRSFLAPFVAVTRKADGVRGLLMFQHSPRFYFDFTPDTH
jgi:hypothetical protein